MIASEEIRHVDRGPLPDETPEGVGLIEVRLSAEGSAADVVEKSKSVVRAVLSMSPDELRSPSMAAGRLPEWFVASCVPERSAEAAAEWLAWWRGLDPSARARAADEQPWALADWLYWMQPEERQWYWWDARVDEDRSARVFVQVFGWPTPTGALVWLLRAAGASLVEVCETA